MELRNTAGTAAPWWRGELAYAFLLPTVLIFLLKGKDWFGSMEQLPVAGSALLCLWILAAILLAAFAVVRHAECLAVRLGEPYGTIILTLAVISIEVMMISSVMLGSDHRTVARDTMFGVIMIVLTGLLGLSLVLGSLKFHEQSFNLQGANAFLSLIIPLALLGLVLPDFTRSTDDPTFSPLQATVMAASCAVIYGLFLAVQTRRHSAYFKREEESVLAVEHEHSATVRSVPFHVLWLLLYILPVVVLSKKFALALELIVRAVGAPPDFGGFIVALLILAPEGLGAIRASLANQLQRSVNILLGSVLATIGLTIPAVLTIGLLTGQPVVLGLDLSGVTLLALTLLLTMLTFSHGRTNLLQGAVHLLLFVAYFVLIFED